MTDVVLRDARPGDAASLAALIAELEFAVDPAGVEARIEALAEAGEPVIVAECDGAVVGLLDWHVMPTVHRPRPVGRIATMVVADGRRGAGIGTAMVREAERRMAARGCGVMEVTSNFKLPRAHAFYERYGLERSSVRFAKTL